MCSSLSVPVYVEPQMHLFFTGVGFYVGYLAHRYEEGSEERTQMLLSRYRHAQREWVEKIKDDQGNVFVFLDSVLPCVQFVIEF